jgi:hypothetical protein
MSKTIKASPATTPVKEVFFQEQLVPTGQLAELYLEKVKKHCKWEHHKLSQMLFDNLGLVSIFAISPATPADKKLFSAMSVQLEHLKSTLKEGLLKLNVKKPDSSHTSAFRSQVLGLAGRIEPQLEALRTCMQFSDTKRGVWLDSLVEKPTALTQKGRYSKWRTLVRNMDFQMNMAGMGLATVAEDVSLGSSQGREELPELWRSLFRSGVDSSAPAADTAEDSSSYLPAGITVQSNHVGALAVSAKFDPNRVLKKLLAEVSTVGTPLPAELKERLVSVEFTALCGYKDLPATVAEAIQWRANLTAQAEETGTLIVAFQKMGKLAQARAKLQQTLSEEDLALLAEAGDLKLSASTAKKPSTKKPAAVKPAATKPAAPRRKRASASA